MGIVDAQTLELVGGALHAIGVACGVIFAYRFVRAGGWENPLPELPPRGAEPEPIWLGAIGVGYVLLSNLLIHAFGDGADSEVLAGSAVWHLRASADSVAKLISCIGIVVLMAGGSRGAGAFSGLKPIHIALGGVATGMALLPICFSQLYAAKTLWALVQPAVEQPEHEVIQALAHSEWGRAGTMQLCLVALVVAPFTEELFFRGLLLGTLWRVTGLAWLAILISGLAFGLIHMAQPQDVVALATMGVILGYLRMRYRSLPLCILAHALFNLRTMAFVLLNPEAASGG